MKRPGYARPEAMEAVAFSPILTRNVLLELIAAGLSNSAIARPARPTWKLCEKKLPTEALDSSRSRPLET